MFTVAGVWVGIAISLRAYTYLLYIFTRNYSIGNQNATKFSAFGLSLKNGK
jgi:hypothetical protein